MLEEHGELVRRETLADSLAVQVVARVPRGLDRVGRPGDRRGLPGRAHRQRASGGRHACGPRWPSRSQRRSRRRSYEDLQCQGHERRRSWAGAPRPPHRSAPRPGGECRGDRSCTRRPRTRRASGWRRWTRPSIDSQNAAVRAKPRPLIQDDVEEPVLRVRLHGPAEPPGVVRAVRHHREGGRVHVPSTVTRKPGWPWLR